MAEQIKAGRELDALIETEVFGRCAHFLEFGPQPDPFDDYTNWVCKHCDEVFRGLAFAEGYRHPKLKHYSTQIADAWLVVEKLEEHEDTILFGITRKSEVASDLQWFARFRKVLGNHHDYVARADTAPLAICLAALKAVEK